MLVVVDEHTRECLAIDVARRMTSDDVLALERAGQTNEALDAYDGALALQPAHMPALQGKASLQVRTRATDAATPDLLRQIALRGDPSWRAWAELWLVKVEAER